MAKLKLEDIREELTIDGWQVLSTEYTNLETEMDFQCPEGHKVSMPYKALRNKRYCPVCAHNQYKQTKFDIQPKKKGVYRILALDQATYHTGWAIYDDAKLVAYGIYESQANDEIARDHDIKVWLISMYHNWQPDLIGLEGIQLQADIGVTTYETLARLQGILMETCFEANIGYEICHTAVWRKHCQVKGTSRVDKKRSMQELVKKWFDITVTDDASDAIGIGKYLADTTIKQFTVSSWE